MRWTIGWAALLWMACNGGLNHGVFRKDGIAYRVGPVPAPWQEVKFKNNDLAYVDPQGLFLLGVNSTCEGHGDPPLSVLTNDLLIGFDERQEVSSQEGMLDGRAALRSRYRAQLDGVPVELELVVLKKDGCVYDFIYVAPSGRFGEKQGDYERLLQRFTTEVG